MIWEERNLSKNYIIKWKWSYNFSSSLEEIKQNITDIISIIETNDTLNFYEKQEAFKNNILILYKKYKRKLIKVIYELESSEEYWEYLTYYKDFLQLLKKIDIWKVDEIKNLLNI